MTAKQELLELVEGLSEEAAERLLPLAKGESRDAAPAGNAAGLLALIEQWQREGDEVSPEDARAYDDLIASLEPVRFKLADEW